MGCVTVQPTYVQMWKSKCQPKQKFFFWLILWGRLNTKSMLKRRNIELDSYTCEKCILQKDETLSHLFFRCNFVMRCWSLIGVTPTNIEYSCGYEHNSKEDQQSREPGNAHSDIVVHLEAKKQVGLRKHTFDYWELQRRIQKREVTSMLENERK